MGKTKRKKIKKKSPAFTLQKISPAHKLFAVLLLTALCFIIYSNILKAPFVFDDVAFRDDSRLHIDRLSQLGDIISDPGLDRKPGFVTFALNFYFGGLNPLGYHLTNILIHIFCAILLMVILYKTLILPVIPDRIRAHAHKIALLSAMLWIVHPVNIMAVTYIVQRFASLAALFFLLSFFFYIKARQCQPSKKWLHILLSLTAGILALATKQNTAMLPLLIFLYDLFFFMDFSFKKNRKKIFVISGILICVFIILTLVYIGPGFISKLNQRFEKRGITPGIRVITEFRVVVWYVSLMILPHPSRLNVDYDFPASAGLFSPASTFMSLILLGTLFVIVVTQAKRYRVLSFCFLWFFANLLIESSIIPLDLVYEHRLYLPSMALLALAAGMVFDLNRPLFRKAGIAVCLIVTVLFGFWTYQRNAVWKSPISLWEDNAKKSPQKARVLGNLGKAYLDAKEYDKARIQFEKMQKIDPSFIGSYNNLAVIYINHYKDYDKARDFIQQAIERNPAAPNSYLNLGVINLELRHLPEALENFTKVLELDPSSHQGYYNLGATHFNLKEYAKAITTLQTGIAKWPRSSKMYGLLGFIYVQTGNESMAWEALNRAIELDPQNQMALNARKQLISPPKK